MRILLVVKKLRKNVKEIKEVEFLSATHICDDDNHGDSHSIDQPTPS